MSFVNKGLYTITSDGGAKFAFTLFEGITTDNGSSLLWNSIQCSLVGYSSGYTMKAMNAMTFNNGAVTLRKRDSWYLDAQLIDSGGTLNWGGNVSSDNGYDCCCPIAVYHYTDNDTWGLSGVSFSYIKRTDEIPPADTTKWNDVAIATPSGGNAGYFSGIVVSGTVTSENTGFITSQSHPQIVELLLGAKPFTTDPYEQGGGESGTDGGSGDFDGTSDSIDFPTLPTIGAVDSGFITIFNPTLSEVKSLATYMWTNPLFDLTTWKKIFADPMDAILGLSLVPVPIPDGGSRAIKVGNIATDVTMNVAATQFVEIQCGTINVNEYWGAYLDYSPYTKAEIYLPYCGTHQLSIDDVMNKSVEVRYHVDILSGACCAYVKCGDSVLYTFLGQCSSSIPIAANDFTHVINGVLSAAVSIGSMVASGGISAPLAVPALASTAVNSMKENVEKSGAISGTGGILAIQKPYLILTRPRQAVPANQNSYTGYPSFITEDLSTLSGYTEIEAMHLEGLTCMEEEMNEIVKLLHEGVFF